jgi:protein-disulfide isomerase
MNRLALALLLPLLCAPARAERLPAAEEIAAHIRKTHGIPPDVPVKLGALVPAGMPAMQKAELTIGEGEQRQDLQVFFSQNGRHYFIGSFSDLALDPDDARASKLSLEGAASKGPKDAPVVIVEFSDFQCPYCRTAHQALAEELKAYPGTVRLVFKHFPLTRIHPWAETAAVAAACALEQDPEAFWTLADGFFEKQGEIDEKNVKEKAVELASRTRVKLPDFNRCLDKRAALEKVKKDQAEGLAAGVTSTPFFFVNGHPIRGYKDFEPFKAAIEAKLGEAKR